MLLGQAGARVCRRAGETSLSDTLHEHVNHPAAPAGQGSYKQAVRDTPAAMGQFQKLGTRRK